MTNEHLKVGDKVKWSGNYFKNFKPGKTKEDLRNTTNSADVVDCEYKEGVSKIAYIGPDIKHNLFEGTIIELENGKIFSQVKNTLIPVE